MYRKNAWTTYGEPERAQVEQFAKGYMAYLDASKTEREAADAAEELCRVISRETGVPAVCGGGIRASLGMALEQCPAEGVICVFGSLYQAGEVRAFFDNRAEG